MQKLNKDIRDKILDYLKASKIGASSSEISKSIGHNRITVTKYLEIMKAEGEIDYEGVAQAKLWNIKKRDKPVILIVDDEPHVVDLVAYSLIPERYTIIKAYSGLDALNLIYKETPDLIILDLMMPGVNGYELCQKIKENSVTKHIPVIILSAKGEVEDKLRGLKIGAEDYLTKPFDPMELEARVERMIRRAAEDQDTHPVTKLPGMNSLMAKLSEMVVNENKFHIYNFRIANLEKYGDKHGYKKVDNVLNLVSRIFIETFKEKDAFVAHTLNDHFVIMSDSDEFEKHVSESFKKLLPYLDPEKRLSLKSSSLFSKPADNRDAETILEKLGVK